MCEPVTTTTLITAAVVAAASTATTVYAQQQSAEAQAKAQSANFQVRQDAEVAHRDQVAQNANAAFLDHAAQANLRVSQEEAAAGQEVQEAQRIAVQRAGTAVASSNAAGQSLDALVADFYRQEGNYRNAVQTNLEFTRQQTGVQNKGARNEAISRTNSSPLSPFTPSFIDGPNLVGSVGNFLTSTFNSYTALSAGSPRTGATTGATTGARKTPPIPRRRPT